MPCSLSLSATATNWAQSVGGLSPCRSNTLRLSHSQLTRWMPVGTAIRAPFWLSVSRTMGGS